MEFIHIDVCSPLCVVVSDVFQLHMLSPEIWVNIHLMRKKCEIFENVQRLSRWSENHCNKKINGLWFYHKGFIWVTSVTRKINELWFYHKGIYLSCKFSKTPRFTSPETP